MKSIVLVPSGCEWKKEEELWGGGGEGKKKRDLSPLGGNANGLFV